MVSLESSLGDESSRSLFPSASSSGSRVQRAVGRSMRTIRSTILRHDRSTSAASVLLPSDKTHSISESLSEAAIDVSLSELVRQTSNPLKLSVSKEEFLDLSQSFSNSSACSSDISGELQRLACVPLGSIEDSAVTAAAAAAADPRLGFPQGGDFLSSDIIESVSPSDLHPTVRICVDALSSPSIEVKTSAAAKLRFLAKNRPENRALIGECGGVPGLVPLLRCGDAFVQEHAVTALFNLSLHNDNKSIITQAGAIKPLIYVLKTGTETSKQNAACALLSLALVSENRASIGACGAIPPLISLLVNGSNRGKKDALTTLYKLCSIKLNKERAVNAGAVKPLVCLVTEKGNGLAEKAMVVLSCLAGIPDGKSAIADEGGVAALVEAAENGSAGGKEFALVTLLQLCADSVENRILLVREGGIPPLVILSQTGSSRCKQKAETLLGYLRQLRNQVPCFSSSSIH